MTRNEVKKIATFSWLIRKAEQLSRKDPAEYTRLRSDGSDKFLKGCITTMSNFDTGNQCQFALYSPGNAKKGRSADAYVVIDGHREKGKFYTRYNLLATATKYRKRMHKWLPISLPEGMKCDGTTPAVYFNADGSVHRNGKFFGGRRMRRGTPDAIYLVIRDGDGKFVDHGMEHSLASHGNELLEKSVGERFHYSDPIDLAHSFLPGTVQSKLDWYKSMVPPEVLNHDLQYDAKSGAVSNASCSPPLWDADKVRLMAAKVHSAALRLTKSFPHIKIAMYPAEACSGDETGSSAYEEHRTSRFGGLRTPVVVGFTEHGTPRLWLLPELVVYWIDDRKDTHHHMHDEPRWIRIKIPPAGSKQLERRDNESYLNTVWRWGMKHNTHSLTRQMKMGCVIERAYHGLVSLRHDPSVMDGQLWSATRRRQSRLANGQNDFDHKLHDWDRDPMGVIVFDASHKDSGYKRLEPRVMKPEVIFNAIEERELVDSLPLC